MSLRGVAIGLVVFACSLLLTAYGINAIGQIRGTFHYDVPQDLIAFCQWTFSFVLGLGITSVGVGGLVAWREHQAQKIEKPKD